MATAHIAQAADPPPACHQPVARQPHESASPGRRSLAVELRQVHIRSVVLGGLAGAGLGAVFVAVVAGTAGWGHLVTQVRDNWWLLPPLLAGFMTQVTLMAELRHRHRLMHTATVSVGAGAGVSGAGMVACCAHHLADLAPLAGATGFAAFLTDLQRPVMLAGLAFNVIAVAYAARLLHRIPAMNEAGASCTR